MMFKIKTMLFAENVIRDAETDSVTLFNLLDSATNLRFPFFFPTFCIFAQATRQEKDPSKFNCRIIVSIDKDRLFDTPMDIDFQDKPNSRVILKLLGLAIPHPGELEARLICEKHTLGRYRITLRATPQVKKKQ